MHIRMCNTKTDQNFNPGLMLIDLSGTGPRLITKLITCIFHSNIASGKMIYLYKLLCLNRQPTIIFDHHIDC